MSEPRPDILLVHCHDLGDWLTAYGKPGIPDPRITRLAEQSVVFENAFATSPLCTPARSSIFTGLLPHQNGLMGLSHTGWQYAPGVVTLPERLSAAGYRTALLGLQHEDLDAHSLGFDDVIGLGFLPRSLEVATLTQRWLDEGADDPTPRFGAVGFWEVHRPWPASDYDPADPESVWVPPYLPDNEHVRRDIADFLGAIRQLDEAIGRVLDALDSTERGRETLLVFTTDHGAAFPRAKSTLYDSGTKVAFMIRPPVSWGIAARRADQMVSHLDLVPTVLSAANASSVDGLDGLDLIPLLADGAISAHRDLMLEKTYHDRYDPIRAIRTTDAKYIRNFVDAPRLPLPTDLELSESRLGLDADHLAPRPAEELYRLDDDPWELVDLASDPGSAELKAALAARLDEEMARTHDPLLDGAIAPPARRVPLRKTVGE